MPTLGLALSGGGSRGIAHLGVLQAMFDDGLRPAAVAGTSVGALVGAFLCAGFEPEEIESILRRRDWGAILSGLDDRRRVLSRSEELLRGAQLSLRLRGGRSLEVGALAESGRLQRELYRYLLRAQLESGGEFDRLRFRFRPVAADVLTGEPVVPARGDLVAAVRGSAAVPGVFPPVAFGDGLLVDGGLVENVPVETARRLGTRLVVAVDTSEAIVATEAVRGAPQLLRRSLAIMAGHRTRALRDQADLVITPEVAGFSQSGLRGNLDALVRAGRLAYAGARDAVWRQLEGAARDPRTIAFDRVEVRGTDWIDAPEIARRLGGVPGAVPHFRVAAELARALNRGPLARGHADWLETPGGRVLRFVFEQHAPIRVVQVRPAPPPRTGDQEAEPPGRFSAARARRLHGRARERMLEHGRVLVRAARFGWDPTGGTFELELAEERVARIVVTTEGAIRAHHVRRFLRELEGDAFVYDRLANRLDELVARGVVREWALRPVRDPAGDVELAVHLRGDDHFEIAASGAFRGPLGFAGFVRGAKANLTGRGDGFDLLAIGARDGLDLRARYRTEYGVRFRNLGGEVTLGYFDRRFLAVDAEQELVETAHQRYRGERATIALFRRSRIGAVVRAGALHETERLARTATEPRRRFRRSAGVLEVSLDRHERLLFPQRGAAVSFRVERAFSGFALHRAELAADAAFAGGGTERHVAVLRAAAGWSEGAARRPFWFDPGGFRELYGFVPYGAAAPQYARAGARWRYRVRDLDLARVYVEAGADWIATATERSELRGAGGRFGYGVSLIAHNRFLGPITLGAARNDDGANLLFVTVGFPLPRR